MISPIYLKQALKDYLNLDCVLEYQFAKPRKWRIDCYIPSLKLAIEFEGGVYTNGRHTRGQGFLNDIEKYNTITLHGLYLLRFAHVKHTYTDVIASINKFQSLKNNLHE